MVQFARHEPLETTGSRGSTTVRMAVECLSPIPCLPAPERLQRPVEPDFRRGGSLRHRRPGTPHQPRHYRQIQRPRQLIPKPRIQQPCRLR